MRKQWVAAIAAGVATVMIAVAQGPAPQGAAGKGDPKQFKGKGKQAAPIVEEPTMWI
jgi:hypothetical protein